MRNKSPISIFEYVDYRFFLSDYFNHQKKTSRGFSHRSFAMKAGVSVSTLKDILSKRQNLTFSTMEKYAVAMKLTPKETAYFQSLVGFNNSTTNNEKNRFFGEMVRLRGRSNVKFLDIQQYEYFSKWYHSVVRELITHAGLGCDPEAIAKCIVPAISIANIKKSIDLLKNLGLIYQDQEGLWKATDKVISSEYEIQSVALKNYHLSMLKRAAEALENCPKEYREFQGLTISASRTTLARMKERIRSFTDELLNMAASENEISQEVYQINLQMFPLTRMKGHHEQGKDC